MERENPSTGKKPTKAEKSRIKKKAAIERKRAAKASKPRKPIPEPRLPATIIPPKLAVDLGKFSDESALLEEIHRRYVEKNSYTLRISPIPKNCAPCLLSDFCPSALTVRIPRSSNSRFAFLEFKSKTDAQVALTKLNGQQFDGKAVKLVSCADCQKSDVSSTWKSIEQRSLNEFELNRVYVSRLPRSVIRTDLAQLFRTATGIDYPTMPDGTCRGSCILKFKSVEEALKAFANMHGTILKGVPIYVNFSIKRKSNESDKTGKTGTLAEQTPKAGNPQKRKASPAPAEGGNKNNGKAAKRARVDTDTTDESAKTATLKNAVTESKHTKKAEFTLKKATPTKTASPKLTGHQLTHKSDNKKLKQKEKKM